MENQGFITSIAPAKAIRIAANCEIVARSRRNIEAKSTVKNGAVLLRVCPSAIGQFGITAAYRFARPNEIAVYDYFNIPCTAAFGYLLFGQVSDALSILGMFIIVIAAICLNFRKNK